MNASEWLDVNADLGEGFPNDEALRLTEEDMKVVADFLHRAVQIAATLQKEAGSKLLKDFVRVATTPEEGKVGAKQVQDLKKEVREFARRWPLPGVDVSKLTRPAGIEADD